MSGQLHPADDGLPTEMIAALEAADALAPPPTDPDDAEAWAYRRLAALVPFALATLREIAHDPDATELDRQAARDSLAARVTPPRYRRGGET